jgi:hypothetical protein
MGAWYTTGWLRTRMASRAVAVREFVAEKEPLPAAEWERLPQTARGDPDRRRHGIR